MNAPRGLPDRDGQSFETTLARCVTLAERSVGRELDQAELDLVLAAAMRFHGAPEAILPAHVRRH